MNLLRAAATVGALTMLSRVTGLARDVVLARLFGAGADMDAFNVAFRLPNLLRRIFAEGAFSQAFVPLFAAARTRDGDDAGRRLLTDVFSALFWAVLVVSVLGVLAAPLLVWVIASGLEARGDTFALATLLTRWMFPYILFMSLVACLAAALNAHRRFAVPAFTPVLLNLSFIGAAMWLAPQLERPIVALAAGVLIGGIAQLGVQAIAVARLRLLPRIVSPFAALRSDGAQRVMRQMLPALFGVSVAQLSLIINTNIASHLAIGSVSWVSYADRLMELPTALLGVAAGTVLLPALSAAHAQANLARYRELLGWGLRVTLLLAVPATLGLALLSREVVAVLFEGNRFTATDVSQTAAALMGYCIGLPGLVAIKILAPAFYARGDIRTPVKIAVCALVATQIANLVLVPWFAHAGLTAAISIGALLNAGALYVMLRRHGIVAASDRRLLWWARFALALAAMAAVVIAARFVEPTADALWARRAAWLAAVVAIAAAAYFGVLWLLGLRTRDFVVKIE